MAEEKFYNKELLIEKLEEENQKLKDEIFELRERLEDIELMAKGLISYRLLKKLEEHIK